MTELEQYIKSYFGLSKDELTKIASFFQPSELAKGDYYLKSGRFCDKMSFIKSGLLRVYVTTEDKEVTQWISSKGFFVTDLSSFIFQTTARWNIQALTDCELYTIDRKEYLQLGKHVPHWHELEKLFIAKCFTMLEDRVFCLLSMSAEERYQLLFKQQKELFNQVPQQYLASMCGMTPETFSRIRKRLSS